MPPPPPPPYHFARQGPNTLNMIVLGTITSDCDMRSGRSLLVSRLFQSFVRKIRKRKTIHYEWRRNGHLCVLRPLTDYFLLFLGNLLDSQAQNIKISFKEVVSWINHSINSIKFQNIGQMSWGLFVKRNYIHPAYVHFSISIKITQALR